MTCRNTARLLAACLTLGACTNMAHDGSGPRVAYTDCRGTECTMTITVTGDCKSAGQIEIDVPDRRVTKRNTTLKFEISTDSSDFVFVGEAGVQVKNDKNNQFRAEFNASQPEKFSVKDKNDPGDNGNTYKYVVRLKSRSGGHDCLELDPYIKTSAPV